MHPLSYIFSYLEIAIGVDVDNCFGRDRRFFSLRRSTRPSPSIRRRDEAICAAKRLPDAVIGVPVIAPPAAAL
jgi:hypothetical protein